MRTLIPIICRYCGDTKYLKPSKAKIQKYCSKKCQFSVKISPETLQKISGKNNYNWIDKIQWSCPQCGTIQMLTPRAAKIKKFCTSECRYSAGMPEERKEKLRKFMLNKLTNAHPAYIENPNVKQLLQRCFREGHKYIIKKKGTAKNYKCIDCDKQAQHWTNKDHKYSLNIADYQPRCCSCHRKYDIKLSKHII